MREIVINYNPYELKTEILVDGHVPKGNSRLNFQNNDKRLQEWIEDLPSILWDEYCSREFNITFHGTTLDYEDIDSVVANACSEGFKIKLKHIPAKEISDKEKEISKIFQEIQEGPFEELKKPDVIQAFNNAKSKDFKVNVIATMSAGKSTLINALLQKKLMPSKQEACTATITEIKDTDNKNFSAKVYDKKDHLIESHDLIDLGIMERLNQDPNVSKIEIEGNIPFLTAEGEALVLVDTPGPNNSRDPEHKATTYRMLSESSKALVVYVLNATQLAVNDDADLLKHVAESMKVGGKQSRDRFIFVVNKLDDFYKDEDSIDSAINKVRDYLKDKGIENANIFPASAGTALDIRTLPSNDEDAEWEIERKVRIFKKEKMHFEKLAPLPPSARGTIQNKLEQAEKNEDDTQKTLIHCGIIPIEIAIKMYVEKYAKTAKIKNIVDTFSKRLESAASFENIMQEIASNKSQKKQILENIDILKKNLASGENAKKFKSQIAAINYDHEIQNVANTVIKDAQEEITNKLETDNPELSRREAEEFCRYFARFSNNLMAEVRVKLEDVISDYVYKNAEDLLSEYKNKLSSLSEELDIGNVLISPFELIEGELPTDTYEIIDSLIDTKRVQVDSHWVKNTDKAWWKFWTWFDEDGHWVSVYQDQEYVNATKLGQELLSPIQEVLYSNCNSAVEYAKQQSKNIKDSFYKKFEELDSILEKKLDELERFTVDQNKIEQRIQQSQVKLDWLKNIQDRIKKILDI